MGVSKSKGTPLSDVERVNDLREDRLGKPLSPMLHADCWAGALQPPDLMCSEAEAWK